MGTTPMETYAAMVTNMDAGMGRVVDALKTTGQYDNTLILFLATMAAVPKAWAAQWYSVPRSGPELLKPMGKETCNLT